MREVPSWRKLQKLPDLTQAARNEEIYSRMHGLLEGLRGTTQGTQDTLKDIVQPLLQAATNTAAETVRESKGSAEFDPDEFQRRLIEQLRTATQQSTWSTLRESPYLGHVINNLAHADLGSKSPSSEDQAIAEQLGTFPDEETGREAFEQLRELTPHAQNQLRRLGEKEINDRRHGRPVGLYTIIDEAMFTKELERKGLVARTGELGSTNSERIVLTPRGREVARLLTAKGRVPDWIRRLSEY